MKQDTIPEPQMGNPAKPSNAKDNAPTADVLVVLESFERWDYERLKRLEMLGIEAYQELRKAKQMTPQAVLAFIHQLSPWNLKSTGMSVLQAYVNKQTELTDMLETDPVTNKRQRGDAKS